MNPHCSVLNSPCPGASRPETCDSALTFRLFGRLPRAAFFYNESSEEEISKMEPLPQMRVVAPSRVSPPLAAFAASVPTPT